MIEALIRAVEVGDEFAICMTRQQLLNEGWTDKELLAKLGVREIEHE